MIETAHNYQQPYKPKQRFAQYTKNPNDQHISHEIESSCRNLDIVQAASTITAHQHYLSQNTSNILDTMPYQINNKEIFHLNATSTNNLGLPVTSSNNLTPTKLISNSPPIVKCEPNSEQKAFSDQMNSGLTSMMKSSGNKISASTNIQVPCLVCGDEASGFHYGVNSCEGCKVS